MRNVPLTRGNATATPLNVVDGWQKGPDGERLHPFARFAERIMVGGTVEATSGQLSQMQLAGGAALVINPDGSAHVLMADGAILPIDTGETADVA